MTQPSAWLYDGRVRHRRFVDGARSFSYGLYMCFFDVGRVDEALDRCLLTSARRPAPVRFRRQDYFGDPSLRLDEQVRRTVAEAIGCRPEGPVYLLTNLRTLGVSFNPVSFYYCYDGPPDAGGAVEAIVAEITNTPWGERHCYVLDADAAEPSGQKALRWGLGKEFHVSPFLPMDMSYRWTFTRPTTSAGEPLVVHMTNHAADGERAFDANLSLRRGPALSSPALLWRQVCYPVLPALVLWRIYRQAAALWLRGTTFYDHPSLATGSSPATTSGQAADCEGKEESPPRRPAAVA